MNIIYQEQDDRADDEAGYQMAVAEEKMAESSDKFFSEILYPLEYFEKYGEYPSLFDPKKYFDAFGEYPPGYMHL